MRILKLYEDVDLMSDSDIANIKKTGKAYKVFRMKSDGKLYPPMVDNPGGSSTPIGVWINASEGEFAGLSKTGRSQVKSSQGGQLSYRPGWHLGDYPRAEQFEVVTDFRPTNAKADMRVNTFENFIKYKLKPKFIGSVIYVKNIDQSFELFKATRDKLLPCDFVWAECDYVMDIDYQDEAHERGYWRTKIGDDGNVVETRGNKFQHSYAGLPKLPKNGYYKYRTNPNPNTIPWVITGHIKVNRILGDDEVNAILKSNGKRPIRRQGGNLTTSEIVNRLTY